MSNGQLISFLFSELGLDLLSGLVGRSFLGLLVVVGHAVEKIIQVDHLLLFLFGGGLGRLLHLFVLLLFLDLAQILLKLLAVLLSKCLLLGLIIESRVGGGAISERVADNELLAIFEEVLQAVVVQVLQVLDVFLVLAELVAGVNEQGTAENTEDCGANVGRVVTNLERVERQEGVARVVAIDEVVREQPELEAKVVQDAPENGAHKRSHDEEHQQVKTAQINALLEPERPQAEAHQDEDDNNDADEIRLLPEIACAVDGLVNACFAHRHATAHW